MGAVNSKKRARSKRKIRIRKKISGTPDRPRLSVFRSACHIYVQIIDDTKGHTLFAVSTNEEAVKTQPDFKNKISLSFFVGKLIAERAINGGIKKVVFDRNGFLYHGRVKAVADGARKAGLLL